MHFALSLFLCTLPILASDKDDVVSVVQKTFDRMAAHDGPGIEALFLKDPRLVASRESGESTSTAVTDFATRIDGKRTHCGVDQVNLVKTPDGWRIATLIYTIQTTNCPDSPLGPVN